METDIKLLSNFLTSFYLFSGKYTSGSLVLVFGTIVVYQLQVFKLLQISSF